MSFPQFSQAGITIKKALSESYYSIENSNRKFQYNSVNIDEYDDEIIQIINKYSNLNRFGGIYEYAKVIDLILVEINKLEFVSDAFYDKCAVKNSIFPVPFRIGVKLLVNDLTIEKCYDIVVCPVDERKRFFGKSRKILSNRVDYLSNYIKNGFIDEQRAICATISKYDDVWKVRDELALNMVFMDTLNYFVVDSLTHNLGLISDDQLVITKYMKYIGEEEITLKRINNLPFYIAVFPQTTLMKNQTYLFTVIFPFENNVRPFQTELGFELSNGSSLMFEFKGNNQIK
ncbi:hypothetical protein [Brumimicrobium mesophilum]|uniref:hypothetical protein n=1 Tax=Brumimicrobium mesophilum TaxID=392717 RepID=UPI000D13ED07|nr:hypothetical protein [Brumimicrobium mesophilum]